MTVAATILDQLGGHAFTRMTGAKNFLGGPDSLSFTLPGGGGFCKHGINFVRISLRNDLYDVDFSRIRGLKVKSIALCTGIYFDQLHAVFSRETGLILQRPR